LRVSINQSWDDSCHETDRGRRGDAFGEWLVFTDITDITPVLPDALVAGGLKNL
jgi:hypothetical protein